MIILQSLADVKYFCETYLWKNKGVLNHYAEFTPQSNSIEASLITQLKELDKGETYLHVEHMADGIARIYPIASWRTDYLRECKAKEREQATRKQYEIDRGIALIIKPKVQPFFHYMGEKQFDKIIDDLIRNRNNPAMNAIFKVYGIADIKEIEMKVVAEFSKE